MSRHAARALFLVVSLPLAATCTAAVDRTRPGRAGGGEEVVWVEGTARDEQGRALAEADVYVRTSASGPLRMYEEIRTTTTDDRGHYRVVGPVGPIMEPLTVIVHAEGRPPAVAYGPAPTGADDRRPPLDVTLAARGGTVRVRVRKDGRPLPDAGVRLMARGVPVLSKPSARGSAHGRGREGLVAIFQPTAQTDRDGVAQFEGLFPGTYEVIAVAEPVPGATISRVIWPRDPKRASGIAEDLAVAAGQEVEHTIAVHPQPIAVRFQVLRPDGTPPGARSVSLVLSLDRPGTWASIELDERGIGRYVFDSPGLWHVAGRFGDSEPKSSPVREEPSYQAEGVVPVSPGLELDEPVRLVAARRKRGSLRVQLRDAEGRPARGAVTIEGVGGETFASAGTTDAEGVVRFADLPGGSYRVRGSIEGREPPAVSGPLPDDAALRGRVAVPDRTATVEAGVEARVELPAQAVGYVRGTLRPPAGDEASGYDVYPTTDLRTPLPQWRLDRPTGQFVCGPLPAGTLRLILRRRTEDGTGQVAGTQEVEVVAGEVVGVDLRPGAASPPTRPGAGRPMLLGIGGSDLPEAGPHVPAGTARLADERTPAFGAHALLFVPGQSQPLGLGISDAAGRLTWRARWIFDDETARVQDVQVPRPTAVVRLPGRSGAAVVEFDPDRPIRAVLPRPIVAAGRVTLGGKPIDGRNVRVRVVAAHRGRGGLDAALGLEATAQADGRFALRGLTPGRHLVQAARDEIWLSKGSELVAEEGQTPPEIVLDIPEPGAPAVVELVDRRGQPVPDRAFTLVRPEGPLAALWPTTFRTDAAGTVTIRGLEAGSHAIQIDGEPGRREIRVPEARGVATRPAVTRIELGRERTGGN